MEKNLYTVWPASCNVGGTARVSLTTTAMNSRPNLAQAGVYAVEVHIDALPLQPDTYVFDIGCRNGDFGGMFDMIPSALQLDVLPGPTTPGFIARRDSGVRLKSRWEWNSGNSEFPLKQS